MQGRMASDDHGTPPKAYRTPKLTVYGTVRDLTQGYGIGKPDNGVSQSHSMNRPNTFS